MVSSLFGYSGYQPAYLSYLAWIKVNIFPPSCYKDNVAKTILYKFWIIDVIFFLN